MSDNLDISIYDFEKICRTCLSRGDLKPLYEKCFPSTCLAEKLMSCTVVKFTEDDGLPMKICTNCINEINQALSFATRCETTDTILRQCVKKFESELAHNSSLSKTIEPLIKVEQEMEIQIKSEPMEEALEDFECEQEVQEEEYVTREEFVKIENEYSSDYLLEEESSKYESYVDPADESVEEEEDDEDQDETYSETSDNRSGQKSAKSKIKKECPEEIDGSAPVKKLKKIRRKPPHYECKKCFEKFSDYKSLKQHWEDVKHPPTAYNPRPCPVCKKMLGYYSLREHMRKHTGEKPYRCDICGICFSLGPSLSLHKLARHSEPNDLIHQCPSCEKSFTRPDLLKRHSRVHAVKEHACVICGKAFTKLNNLETHKLIHIDEKQNYCTICNKNFTSTATLKRHMRMHTGEKPYACGFCGESFRKNEDLAYHKLIHTGEKPFSCSVCNKVFVYAIQLKIHMRTHTGEKPHICSMCNEAFAHHTTLKNHMRKHIIGEISSYSCEICEKKFRHSGNLSNHKRRVHQL